MKRDMDLVRKILLKIEDSPEYSFINPFNIEGYDDNQVSYHLELLDEAGLIKARDESTMGGYCWIPDCLTWEGHEFLEASRDDNRWEKAKKTIIEKGGSFAFSLLQNVLIQLMTKAVLGSSS